MTSLGTGCLVLALITTNIPAQPPATQPTGTPAKDAASVPDDSVVEQVHRAIEQVQATDGDGAWVKWILLVTVLSLAPALAIMVTSFTRIIVVLGLLRQALATPQLPPNQILFGLALLMTIVVMAPVIQDLHSQALEPCLNGDIDRQEALEIGETRIRAFMIRQLEAAGNTDTIYVFLPEEAADRADLAWRDVPTWSLVPAFALGELKVAFLMGLRIFLPFVIIDMLVGAVLVSMGMLMLPPVLIAMPFKLLMFVLADGWTLVAGTLMNSFS
jgi:flagellar biosynthetic protein FliP